MKLSESALLKLAVESGIINLDTVQQQVEMNERQKYLEKHPYSIWEGKDGKWHTYLPDDKKGRVPKKRSSKREIEQLIIDYLRQQEEVITIENAFDEWNKRQLDRRKIGNATFDRNRRVFNRHYSNIKDKDIRKVTPEVFTEFLEEEVFKLHLTAKAFGNLKSITRGMLKRAKKRNLISFNIAEMFDDMDVSEKDFKTVVKDEDAEVFNENELPKIIEYLTSNVDIYTLAMLLMFVTGCRVGEIVTIRSEIYNNENHTFEIRATETCYKGDNEHYVYEVKESPKTPAGYRVVIVPTDYHWIFKKIKMLNPFGEYLFMDDNQRLHANQIRKRLYTICKNLDIVPKSPNKARKTYGTILLDSDVDEKVIERQMGHTDILTTKNHYYKNRKSISTKQRIIDSIPEFKVN